MARDEIKFLREIVATKAPSFSIGQTQAPIYLLQDNATMNLYNIEKAEFLLNDISALVESASEASLPKEKKNLALEQLKRIGENIREGAFREAGKILMDEVMEEAKKALPELGRQIPALVSIIMHAAAVI